MPAALTFPIGSRFYDWRYESEPEPYMNGRRIYHARGKVLGGSSSINGMIFQRGNPLDYERWASDPGMSTWGYAHCLPYFKKMESCLAAARDEPFRGHDGPLALERGPATNPLFTAFFEATVQAGYSLTDDVNGYRQEGFAPFDRNIRKGRRLSAARAYLHPVMKRPNLEVRTNAFVSRIVFDGRKAVGVEVALGRGRSELIRGREIVLAGGAINSPQLLQLSGVGDATSSPPSGSTPSRTCRASVRTSRTTSRSTSSTPPPSRCRCNPRRSTMAPAVDRFRVAVLRRGPGRDEPLRGRGLRPATTTSSTPT